MKRYTLFSVALLALLIWQSANAAMLQPTLKTTPTLELKTTNTLPTLTTAEDDEEEDSTKIMLIPEIKPETVPSDDLEIIPLETEEKEEVEIKPELELEIKPEIKVEPELEITKEPENEPAIEITETEPEKIEVNPEEPIQLVKEAQKVSNITTEVNKEEDGKLKYKLKTVSNFPIYKSESAGTEEIIKIKPKKEIKFSPAKNTFEVEEKEEYDYADLLAKNEDFSMGFEIKKPDSDFASKLNIKPQDNCVEVAVNQQFEKKVSVCDDFDLREDGLYLPSDNEGEDDVLLPPLDKYYETVSQELQEQKANVQAIKLVNSQEEGPHYEVTVEEEHKLFWLIPVSIQAIVHVGVEDNQFSQVDYGWSGLFFSNRDYLSEIKILPDLVITGVKISPKTLHPNDEATIKVMVQNVGLDNSHAFSTGGKGPSRISVYFGENQTLEIDGEDSGLFLSPGESTWVILKWKSIICNAPINAVVDPNNRIEEINEGNNGWSGTVRCLPNDAPDLVVTSMTPAGGTMKVGQTNTVSFTVKNQGSQPAPEFNTFAEWGDGYFKLIKMPALNPDQSYSNTFTYTPENCAAASLRLDSSENILETDEDNNIGYPSDSHCTRRPDLFVENVWWKANGIPAGDIHANEPLWFQVKVKNAPQTYVTNAACVNSFTGVVKLNGNPIKTLNFGNIGCIPDHSNNHPDFWVEKAEFTYTPKCNGEHLTVEIDPNNAVLESMENNNSWTFDVICTAPAPIATPS